MNSLYGRSLHILPMWDLRITLDRGSKCLNELINEHGHIIWIIKVLSCMLMIDLYDDFHT